MTKPARPTILLFDIDGTLVTTPGAARRALERAFVARYGRSGMLSSIRFGGMTDRSIVRAGLVALGEVAAGAAAEATIDQLLAAYVPLLADEVARTSNFRLHPGVRDLLDAIASRPGVALGLGTGNIRAGAHVKLTHVGVLGNFRFGGFGCDHEDRIEILRIGAARGAALLGASPATCRIVVVGDTPRDVAAADALGARSVGIGTGGFGPAELLASGASAAFADLTAPGVLAAVLGGE